MRSIALPSWIERAAGLAPRALPPHAFALSRRGLAYAGFAGDGTGLALLEAQSVNLPESLLGAGPLGVPVGDAGTFAAAVRLLVGRLAKAPKEASLVLPDAWARGLMIDSAELPEESEARREVLRFRLKRLVPYRVEDLRVEAVAAGNGAAGERAFVTFANEALCALVEDGFAAAGIRLGWISGRTAALHAGLCRFAAADPAGGDARALGLTVVDGDGVTLVLSRDGEPQVWRQKTFTEDLSDFDRERLWVAELRLTRSYLEARWPGVVLGRLHLAAPRAVEPFWTRVLADGLGVAPERLRPESVGLDAAAIDPDAAIDLAALAGAAGREVL